MSRAAPAEISDQESFCAVLSVSRETGARFDAWRQLLEKWNARINLVGPSTLSAFWLRHAADGSQLAAYADEGARDWIDFGSGAGAPGIAVALMRADRGWPTQMRLVESNAKKAAFLREAVRACGLGEAVRVDDARIERLAPAPMHVVTARAFAPLDRLLGYAEPWWGTQTRGVFLKGRDVEAEIEAAHATGWRFSHQLAESRSDSDGRVLTVTELVRA